MRSRQRHDLIRYVVIVAPKPQQNAREEGDDEI